MLLENVNDLNIKELEHKAYSKNKVIYNYALKECIFRFKPKKEFNLGKFWEKVEEYNEKERTL